MRIKSIVCIAILVTTFSCSDVDQNLNRKGSDQAEVNETPQVLDGNSDYKSITNSKRYQSDIVSKLYEEANRKNEKLRGLNDAINEMADIKNDSLKEYLTFSQTNKNYWSTANIYINQLQDTALRASTLDIFNALELAYQSNVADHEQKLTEINKKASVLNDQLILLKLLVTQPMIANYQENEQPDIKTLETVINQYDKLINEVEGYTESLK